MNNMQMAEFLSLNDSINKGKVTPEKHGLHGHVKISIKNNDTGVDK